MAKLGVYYGLCPLIDHRSLLGIFDDKDKSNVIVTLGKNIAIKYKLLDQKPLHSWRTKEKFTSPILYDPEQSKYVAVFNESYVRLWYDDEVLDKLKKFKFNLLIHTIFSCNNKIFIVFKNGAVYSLRQAIDERKELNPESVIDPKSEYITKVLCTSVNEDIYIGLVTSFNDENYILYWTKFTTSERQERFCKIKLSRENFNLNGYVFYVDKLSVHFLSLWDDGRIFSIELKDSEQNSSNIGDLFTVIESVSCKNYVSLVTLDQNYIAMYGCNSNEEGALLIIYNVQFKVVQSRQSFKLFTNGAKMWCVDRKLMFPVGQNLAVIPFYLDTEQLAALVGSHKVIESDPDPDVSIIQKVQIANWSNCKIQKDNIPETLKPQILDFLTQGLSVGTIFEIILTDINKKNIGQLTQAINYFSDIPEKCLAKVLKLVLNVESHFFKKKKLINCKDFPKKLQPLGRVDLLDMVLAKSFNETLFLPYLRSVLTVSEALSLLQYIYFLLSEDGHALPSLSFVDSEARLINWSCILIDANYQKFLLTRDDEVNEVISSLRNLIKEELQCFNDFTHIVSLLNEMKKGKSLHKAVYATELNYSVEEFPLY